VQLSDNFSLEELTHSDLAIRKGINNDPSTDIISNLGRLAQLLEQVRKMVGRPITVSSGYRCPELNKAVGGQPNSQHMQGCAADIRAMNMTPDQLVKAIINTDIQFDQLIREFDSWVHISVTNSPQDTPRGQTLIIDKLGTRPYK
jgi:uncharacterized protein YcbK (DUF882 family)